MRRFDGLDDYIHFGTLGNFGSSMADGVTLAYWVAVHEADADTRWWGQGAPDVLTSKLTPATNTVEVTLVDADANMLRFTFASALLFDGNPHHVVITVNGPGDAGAAYVDGVSRTLIYLVQTTADNFPNFTRNFPIGCRWFGAAPASFAEVDICDFQLFTGIASQADVLALMYNLPWMPYQGLTKCWLSFAGRTGMGMADYSGLGYNGTNAGSTETFDPAQLLWGHGMLTGDEQVDITTTTTLAPTTSTSTVPTTTTTVPATTTTPEPTTTSTTLPTTTTTSGLTTTSTTGTTATTCLGPHRLYLSAIQTAIFEHLSNCAALVALVPGGIHDTMAPPAPHTGTEVYPFVVGTIITAADMSAFCESIQWILYQTDIYHDSMSAVNIGEVSRRLQECLDRKLVVEAYGHYYSFHLHATVARRLKEAPDIWRIGSDFEGLVHRIQPP